MRLVSDKLKLTKRLTSIYAGNVVVNFAENNTIVSLLAENQRTSEFRLCQSSALRDAISHQNRHILNRLVKSSYLNITQVSRLLHSGISFCCSRVYDTEAVLHHGGIGIHLINRIDFAVQYDKAVNKLLDDAFAAISEASVSWTTVSHNYCVQAAVERRNFKINIECHMTIAGVVFFRRLGDTKQHRTVYIPPEIVYGFSDGQKPVKPSIIAAVAIPVHPAQINQPEAHPLLQSATKLANEILSNKKTFLRNATESLCILNAICIQTHRTPSTGDLDHHHEMLRAAWLDTYTRRAATLCGGVQNTQFYEIEGHLINLAALSLSSVGYWDTVPYV
jgi:hypothetical protein